MLRKTSLILLLFSFIFLSAAIPFQPAELEGDPYLGGQLYDAWYILLDLELPTELHPLWKNENIVFSTNDITWRCSTCHGWDYKGGAEGMPGIIDVVGQSESYLLAWLNGEMNPRHDFSDYLPETAKTNLVAFMRTRMINIDLLVDAQTGASLGDVNTGTTFFARNCAGCHSLDNSTPEEGADTVLGLSVIATQNPSRFLHKVRFSSPGRSSHDVKQFSEYTLQNLADVLAYVQFLAPPEIIFDANSESSSTAVPNFEGQGDTTGITIGTIIIFSLIVLSIVGVRLREWQVKK